jgi:hypothetical protein
MTTARRSLFAGLTAVAAAVLAATPAQAATADPAGGAAIGQIIIATVAAAVVTTAWGCSGSGTARAGCAFSRGPPRPPSRLAPSGLGGAAGRSGHRVAAHGAVRDVLGHLTAHR